MACSPAADRETAITSLHGSRIADCSRRARCIRRALKKRTQIPRKAQICNHPAAPRRMVHSTISGIALSIFSFAAGNASGAILVVQPY